MALIGEMQYLTIGGNTYSLPSGGGGSVSSVAVSNATNGGLSVSGSPISSSGTITVGHSNVLSSAQTTQAVYPIKIDKNGHISAYGNAVTIPTVNNATLTIQKNGTTVNSFTANASSNVTANITVPTKVSDLTNDSGFVTTDTKNTAGVTRNTSGTQYLITAPYNSDGYNQTYTNANLYYKNGLIASSGYGEDKEARITSIIDDNNIPISSLYASNSTCESSVDIKPDSASLESYDSGTTCKIILDGNSFSLVDDDDETPIYLNSYTGELSITGLKTPTVGSAATTKTYVDNAIPTTAGSNTTGISISDHSTSTIYGVQSSTTTASKVTLGTALSVTGVSGSTTASKVTVGSHSTDYGVTAAGSGSFTSGAFSGGSGSFSATVTNHVLSFSHSHTAATHGADSHSHTAPTLGSKVPTVSASDVTVPKAAASATSIPNVTAATDVTVPIKNSSSTTVVTGKSHTVTDNGHTHTLS